MAKIAILGVKTYPAFAGADRVVENLINNYSEDNEYYLYLCSDLNGQKLPCAKNLHYIYLSSVSGKHLRAIVYFFKTALHLLFKGNYDLIHVHNSDFGLFLPLVWLKNRNIISTFHGDPYQRAKWSKSIKLMFKIGELFFVNFSKKITSVDENKLPFIESIYQKQAIYIPNGIEFNENLNEQAFDTEPSLFSELPKKYIFFACGRLDKTKGLHTLLEAFNSLDFPIDLIAVGDFTHDAEYAKKIELLASGNKKITLIKSLMPKNRLLKLLDEAELFVFPSEVEAMSMMLLEAISVKAPVIASDIPANVSVLGKDYPLYFNDQDILDLLGKMEYFLKLGKNSSEIKELTTQLFNEAKIKFNWKNIAAKYENEYTKLKEIK